MLTELVTIEDEVATTVDVLDKPKATIKKYKINDLSSARLCYLYLC